MRPLLRSLRPNQWTKNFFVFAGLVFSLKLSELPLLLTVSAAFLIFCALSSAIYLINDVNDAQSDRKHPTKKNRPIAAGQLSPTLALIAAALLAALALLAAVCLNLAFALTAFAYFALMVFYTFLLRDIVILDVFCIAAGFVLRAVAGVVVINVLLSPWLVICTILLSLFIALGKRRHELVTLAGGAIEHRRILDEYNPQLLDQLISAVAGSTVMAYSLYTLWPETIAKFGTHNLVYSIPFVLYGIFRYLYLIYKKEKGGKPEELLLTDIPLLADILFWIGALLVIIYLK
ncbi:MAG TPA: decaprenyl-phosphate phosphoribosyltransferase [Candidatus Sulfotelmatobacter sp.]|nr:decaprenyl-phosphate phosphoribosyltransferase [Candidatus Sulfotelmatobacter sp.]